MGGTERVRVVIFYHCLITVSDMTSVMSIYSFHWCVSFLQPHGASNVPPPSVEITSNVIIFIIKSMCLNQDSLCWNQIEVVFQGRLCSSKCLLWHPTVRSVLFLQPHGGSRALWDDHPGPDVTSCHWIQSPVNTQSNLTCYHDLTDVTGSFHWTMKWS